MRNHTVLVAVVAGMLLGCISVGAQEPANESLLGSDGKLTTIDWTTNPKSDAPVETRMAPDASGLLGSLLFLLGLAGAGAALVWYVKNRSRGPGKNTARLAVVERLALGNRRELLLVRVGERLLVLASLQQDVKLIAALPNPELSEAMETDLEHLFQERTLEPEVARAERLDTRACATPSLMIDWPAGPARG